MSLSGTVAAAGDRKAYWQVVGIEDVLGYTIVMTSMSGNKVMHLDCFGHTGLPGTVYSSELQSSWQHDSDCIAAALYTGPVLCRNNYTVHPGGACDTQCRKRALKGKAALHTT